MRVLVVEDDSATRATILSALEARRHDAVACADAESAWSVLGPERPAIPFDLAILDTALPDQDGLIFCRQLRRHPAGRHAVVIAVTADDRLERLSAALESGINDYVLKPVDPRVLAIRIVIAEQRSLANATSRYSREALRESESRFEAFMANSPTAGIGRSHFDVFSPEVAREQQITDAAVLERGMSVEAIERVPLPDGVHDWLTYKFPLHDNLGHPALVAGLAVDITDRIRAEQAAGQAAEALRRQKTRLETLLRVAARLNSLTDRQAVLDAVCVEVRSMLGACAASVALLDTSTGALRLAASSGLSDDAQALLANVPAEVWTRVRDDFRPVLSIPEFRDRVILEDRELVERAGIRTCLAAMVRHEGRLLGTITAWTLGEIREFTADEDALLQGVADQAALAISNAQALADLRQSEEQMRSAQKLESLGILAGGIAHDFNNLLVGVLGNASLALTELPEDSPARPFVKDVETSAQRAAELTRQMLAYSGRGKIVVESLRLSQVVHEMTQLLGRVISKRARLSLHLREDLPPIVADATQVRQVVMNLITNASDALLGEPGLVTVRTGTIHADARMLAGTYMNEELPAGDYVYLEVTDSGVGMDAATRAHIFEPFFTTKFTGRGLGLAAVLGIVRSHKGAIDVTSEPGCGTTFRVLFPASASIADVPVARNLTPANWKGSGVALVVDDEEAVRGVARHLLERSGFSIVEAATGEEALAICAAQRNALRIVLLDLTMPGMSGEATLAELRRRWPSLPVIVSSGFMRDDSCGIDGVPFLPKPYRPAELVDIIRRLFQYEAVAT
jgi:DNA-binding response OmpR family regulator/C4-dicarboxylate-specific signal transduction histidine kinase